MEYASCNEKLKYVTEPWGVSGQPFKNNSSDFSLLLRKESSANTQYSGELYGSLPTWCSLPCVPISRDAAMRFTTHRSMPQIIWLNSCSYFLLSVSVIIQSWFHLSLAFGGWISHQFLLYILSHQFSVFAYFPDTWGNVYSSHQGRG